MQTGGWLAAGIANHSVGMMIIFTIMTIITTAGIILFSVGEWKKEDKEAIKTPDVDD